MKNEFESAHLSGASQKRFGHGSGAYPREGDKGSWNEKKNTYIYIYIYI